MKVDICDDIASKMTVNVTVTGSTKFNLRMWLVMRLLDIIAVVAPFNLDVTLTAKVTEADPNICPGVTGVCKERH